ncbi:hypothetical protein JZ751_024715 [Albula glossodonta]|uniref:STIL centriolar assembly protein n=1 Tax=Albula glossodonta TaxID=121402 RepID=A0A8T2PGH5_9TELE|nr:hypothetical protein JZ751_024715 [Albula glossodonta]
MSVQVNFKGLPPHVLESVYTRSEQQRISRSSDSVYPLTFPKSKAALWDPSPNGDVVSLHLSYYRNPRLLVMEKALRLAHRHARQSNKPAFSCFLLGSLAVENDEESVTLMLDRFDPGREQPGSSGKSPTALLPGDFLVPCTVRTQGLVSNDSVVHSAEDFDISFKRELQSELGGRHNRQHTECCSRASSSHHPHRTGQEPQQCKQHDPAPAQFLTMDQTRKLLLVLESDPKAYTLPLVGVWLSGITHIHNPQVWAWCLRYLYSSSLQDKVMSEDGAFLVVLYSLTHRDPEFYQCRLCSGQQELGFQLLTGTESLTLYKHVEVSEGRSLQFELSAESQNQEAEFFKEVVSRASFTRTAGVSAAASPQSKLSISDHDSGVEDEDLSPRPSPNPHPLSQQTRRIHPSVPELSLVMDGSFLDGVRGPAQEPAAPPALQRRASDPTHQIPPGSRPSGHTQLSGPPPIRRPLTPVFPPAKALKGHTSPGQQQLQQCGIRKYGPPSGRKSAGGSSASSTSSSSSSSTPRIGRSPNSSVHQHRQHSLPAPPAHRGLSPSTPGPPPHTPPAPAPTPPSGYQSPSFMSQTPMHPHHLKNTHNTPSLSSGACPYSCCSHQHGHAPVCHTSPWQGVSSTPALPHMVPGLHAGGACCPSSESASYRECCCSPSHQVSPHQSPICINSSPPHQVCSPVKDSGPHTGMLAEKPVATCQAQCCQGQSGCHVLPAGPALTSAGGAVGLLPADTYRILVDQDRQLKLLQSQIQRLLEAQGKAAGPSPPSAGTPAVCTEQESEATQAPAAPEEQAKKSVAVCTGASLFWSSRPDGSALAEAPLGPEWQSQTQTGSACVGTSHHDSTGPSSVSTDAPSFSRCTDRSEEEPRRPDPHTHSFPSGGQDCQSPLVGESAIMVCPSQSPCRDRQQCQGAETEEREQRFYQELLGQVNTRLRVCTNGGEGEEEETTLQSHSMARQAVSPPKSQPLQASPASPRPRSQKRNSSPNQSEKDQVLQATLRQLKQLGVTLDTLACINPEAVIPRLVLSESVGASIWGPSGSTDLSLEANAIALKYLSDSHLSQFAKGPKPTGPLEAHKALLSGRASTEKSGVGLSILSPSNMSFATKKYMKKYGLIEGGESSEEEEVIRDEDGEKGAHQLDSRENFIVEQDGKGERGLVLKNITNEMPHPISLPPQRSLDTQSQLLRDLRPKMQLLSCSGKKSTQKENSAPTVPGKLQPGLAEVQRTSGSEESMGNFLDLSRLRQLPKLF